MNLLLCITGLCAFANWMLPPVVIRPSPAPHAIVATGQWLLCAYPPNDKLLNIPSCK